MSGLVPPPGQWSFIALVVSPATPSSYLCNTNGQFSATNPVAEHGRGLQLPTLIGDDNADGGTGSPHVQWRDGRSGYFQLRAHAEPSVEPLF
jgi:hypothetical protein